MLDENRLRGKIAGAGMTQRILAKKIGVSENTLNHKINGKRDFTIGEIDRICSALNISDAEEKALIF